MLVGGLARWQVREREQVAAPSRFQRDGRGSEGLKARATGVLLVLVNCSSASAYEKDLYSGGFVGRTSRWPSAKEGRARASD